MPPKLHIVAAALAGVVAYDLYYEYKLRRKNRTLIEKYGRLYANHVEALKACETMTKQIDYMAKVLDANDIALTEFDLIVLHNMDKD